MAYLFKLTDLLASIIAGGSIEPALQKRGCSTINEASLQLMAEV